jgi:AcrR family transcriptional regulator
MAAVRQRKTATTRDARAPRVSAEQARSMIVAAAGRLLRDRRFRDLTVEDVMREAGLARTIFYRHFDGLPQAVLSLLEELVGRVGAARGLQPSPELLEQQLRMVVDLFAEHGPLLLAFEDAARSDPAVEAAIRALSADAASYGAEMIERAAVLQGLQPVRCYETARALNGLNSAYLLELVAEDPGFDRDAALEVLLAIWMRTTWPGAAAESD